MAAFDSHDKCARCRDKRIGEDSCVLDRPCQICDAFSDSQKELLTTPSYRIRKDKKAGLLVSPKDVTVISSVDTEPTFQSSSGPSAQSSAQLTVLPRLQWLLPLLLKHQVSLHQTSLWPCLTSGPNNLPAWRLFYHEVIYFQHLCRFSAIDF